MDGRGLGRQPVLAAPPATELVGAVEHRGGEPAARGHDVQRQLAAARRHLRQVEPRRCCGRARRRRAAGHVHRAGGPSTVTSATAGPASGLTSSRTEACSGGRADAGEPLVGRGARARRRGRAAGRAGAAADQAGGEVVLAR